MNQDAHCPFEPQLRQVLNEELPKDKEELLAAHVRDCPACRAQLDEFVRADDGIARAAKSLQDNQPAPDEMLGNMIDRLCSEGPRDAGMSTAAGKETLDAASPNVSPVALDFLAASDRPQSIGRMGDYEILGVIGSGGMGIVLKAEDLPLHRIVAIKVLKPGLAANAVARRRFVGEAQKAAAVTHDHVVTIHAVGEANGLPFIAMEYIVGVSLDERIGRTGPLKIEEILRIGMQAASGLAAAHGQGLIHRDIKPANILLENGVERVKIADFGLARATDDAQITQPGAVSGTPAYMSPEQAAEEALDHRSDLFSLGSVMYTMCTGRAAFRAENPLAAMRRVCDDTPRPIGEVNPDIPEWLVEIIDRLLEKDPRNRFQSASEVEQVLKGYLAHVQQPSAAPLPSPPQPSTKATAHPARRWIGLAAAVAAVVLLGFFVWNSIDHGHEELQEPGPGRFFFVDLQPCTNRALTESQESSTNQNNLARMPRGEMDIDGVPALVGERYIQLR